MATVLKKAPVSYPMVKEDGTVNKGWLDYFLGNNKYLAGTYTFDTGIVITPKIVELNLQQDISNSTYIVPVDVNNGVVTVDNFASDNTFISSYRTMVVDNEVTLSGATEGYYMISGTLIRG